MNFSAFKSTSARKLALLIILFNVTLFYRTYAQGDLFTPYLNSIPAIKQVLSEVNSGEGPSAITTRKFIFGSRGGTNALYAIMAFPRQKGTYPAILILHGGGSNAEGVSYLVKAYALRGYVAMCFDIPGICNNGKTPNSSGPWKLRPGPGSGLSVETPRFDIAKGGKNSVLFDADVAGIEAFNLIASQPDVDARHIGITGFSWGGYAATFLSGVLGKRVKAAYAVFGCGYYDKGSFWTKLITGLPDSISTCWLRYFDAGRRAAGIKAAYFIEATSNDTYFWPEAVENTLSAVHGTKNHVWDTNFNHKQMPTGPAMQKIYFDFYLKRIGYPFGKVTIAHEDIQPDSSKKLTIKLKFPKGVIPRSVIVYYSIPTEKWQTREWVPISAAALSSNSYAALIPSDLVKKNVNYYAYATDDRLVSTASSMYCALSGLKKPVK